MWFRGRKDSDFQAEIESHIRLEADRLIADGMPAAEAQFAARRAFGNVSMAQERFNESQRWQWWQSLGRDLRYGSRLLRKSPAFTAAAALTIALGVGANTAVFSLLDAVLLQLLPVKAPKELVFIDRCRRPTTCERDSVSVLGPTAFRNYIVRRIGCVCHRRIASRDRRQARTGFRSGRVGELFRASRRSASRGTVDDCQR